MRLRSAVLAALTFALGCASDNGGVVNVLVVASVEVTPGTQGVTPGNTVQLSATPKTSTGLAIPGRAVTWSSSDPTIATVSAGGLVLGVAVGGPVHIQATVDGVTGEALITVFAVPVDHVTVTPSNTPLIVGGAALLTATAFDAAGSPLSGRSFLWQSSAPAIADVSSTGSVLAVAAGGPVTITASTEGKSGTATVTVSPRPASRLGFLQQPVSSIAGQPITPAVRVAVQDDLLGTVVSATNPVTIALAANPGGASLGGTLTVNAVAGIATFSNLTLDRVGTGYTFLVTSPGLTSVTSNPFNVSAGSANRLAFTTPPPGAAQSGVPLTPQPVLQLRDGSGNPVALAGVVVTATIASGTGTLGGSTTATTTSAGTASFTTLALSGLAGIYTLSFGAPGITPVTSAPITLTAGPAAALAMAIQPSSSAQSGVPLAQQPAVQVRDAAGNPVAASGVVITATIAAGSGTLGGITTATTNASGLAQFTSLAINGPSGTYALGFSAPGLTGVISANVILGAAPATHLTITTQPSATAQSGVAFTQQPAVQLRDASNNAVAQAGVVITASIATGGGTLGGTLTATTNASGLATFTNLSITGVAGDRTLAFAAAGLTGVTSGTVTVTAGASSQLGITTQPSASAQSGVAFSQQPVIQLRDAAFNPVAQAGVSITAAINTGGGTLGGTTSVLTDANGTATFTNLSISGTIGQRTLLFAAVGYVSIASTPINIIAGPASQLTITTQPSANGQSGVAFAQQPVIQLRDAAGNAVSLAGTVVTASIASGGGTLGGTATATTNASGVATFTNLSITGGGGTYTLGFAAPSLTGVTSTGITLTATPAVLTITTQPSASAQSGVAFAQPPAVLLLDTGNNPVPGFSVTATISSGPPGATFVGSATATTDGSGVATFTGLGLSGTVGSYTLTFTAGSVTSAASNAIVLGAGAAATVAANSATSQSATVGTAVSAPPSVKVTDGAGNPVAGFAVAFAVTAGGGTVAPASPSTVSSDAGGIATATNWVLGPTAGTNNNTVTATASGLAGSPVTFSASGTAGPASQLTYSTQPSATAQSGAAFLQQPVLLVQDAGNNPVSGVVVTATVTGAPAGVSLVGTTTATTNGSGLASFTNLGLSGPVGSYTLTFTAGALTSGASNSITLAAGAAAKLAVATQPSTTAANDAAFPQQPAIQLQDAAGNPVSQSGTTITAAIATGGGTLGGTLTAVTNAAGLATFTNLKITGTVGDRTLSFSAGGLTGTTSGTITVTTGAASKLGVATQPAPSARNDQAFVVQPAIQVQDISGNPVSQSGVIVTAAIGSGGGTLGGTLSQVTNGSGVAAFTDLKITGTVGNRTLSFTSGGLTAAISNSITIVAGTATQLTYVTQPSTTASDGVAFAQQPVLLVQDVSGNPVGSTVVTATITGSPAGVSFVGTTTATSDGAGNATFTNLGLTGTPGNYTLTFTAGAVSSPASNTIALGAVATQLSITTQPSATAADNQVFLQQPVIQLKDAGNNNVGQAGVSITASLVSSVGCMAALTGATSVVTIATGQASFTNLKIKLNNGVVTASCQIQFSSPGLTSVVSNLILVS